MDNPEHVKRLRQTVEVWNTWRGRAGMLLTASLRRAKGMTVPKIAPWVRAAGIIAAAAVLEFWWWVGLPRWLMIAMIATAIALAPPLVYGVVYGAWWLWWRLPKWQLKSLEPQIPTERRADVEDNFRKTAGQLIGGAAVLIGAGFALFQFLQQQKAAHDLLISNQVSKGFEQLAGAKIEMRLGGIYALEGVMNASTQYHGPVLEALCAFVRESTIGKTVSKPAPDVQAALTVIGRRIEGRHFLIDFPGTLDLAKVSIPEAHLFRADLSGAILHYANLSRASLVGADLSGAGLIGANLSDAGLVGADLSYAMLLDANLTGADLTEANLSRADLTGAARSGAILLDANLTGADLSGAKLTQTQLDEACGDANTKLPEGLMPPKLCSPPRVP